MVAKMRMGRRIRGVEDNGSKDDDDGGKEDKEMEEHDSV